MRSGRAVRWAGRELEEQIDTRTKYANLYRHKLGTVVIPEKLRANLTNLLRGYSRASLAQNAVALAEVLRRRVRARPSDASAGVIKPKVRLRYDYDETQTYVAHRVPGIFATAFRVFREASFKLPGFTPQSMLDFGSGPGTAVWAASMVWPELLKCVAIEPSVSMENVSLRLLGQLEGLEVDRRRRLVQLAEKPHQLVVASYSLGEIQDPVERKAIVKQLWNLVDEKGILVLVEPGSPVGFKTIVDARALLIEEGASLIAPCPHAYACPMPGTKFCHFKQRIRKTPLQMQTKLNKSVNFSDERFSYLVVSRGLQDESPLLEDSHRHRVVRQPSKKGGHVLLETCSDAGKYDTITVAKSHGKDVYRAARKAYWGDEILVTRESKKD